MIIIAKAPSFCRHARKKQAALQAWFQLYYNVRVISNLDDLQELLLKWKSDPFPFRDATTYN